MDTPLQPELLAQHGRFVRALARSLLRDPDAADDVAQETWLRVLAARPSPEGLRPWLRRVVANVSANLRRSRRHREGRERGAAREEALPAADEALVRGELLRAVTEAVLALDAPYRDTLLARYYHGWSAALVASRTATPLATVRSRERRALEELRRRLDRATDGGRSAWALGLARLADAPAAAAAGGIALKLGAVAAVLVCAAFLLRAPLERRAREPDDAGVAAAALDGRAQELASAVAPPAGAQEPEPAPLASARTPLAAGESADGAGGGAAPAGRDAGLAEVRGRFLLPGGAPAADVEVALAHGSTEVSLSPRAPRAPESWGPITRTTGADGRFSIVFAPPPATEVVLRARAPGFVEETHRTWRRIRPGRVIDAGDVELREAGALEGRVLDASGAPLSLEDLKVWARSAGNEGRSSFATVDAATGAFRAGEIAPGATRLSLMHHGGRVLEGPLVEVLAGDTVRADVFYDGPDLGRRVTLRVSTLGGWAPSLDAIDLSGPDLAPLHPRAESSERLVFDDVPPGEHALAIDDPDYLPWRREGVTAGSSVHAELVGSAALRLDVRDARGTPIELYAAHVRRRHVERAADGSTQKWLGRFSDGRLHEADAPLAGGLLEGVVPGDVDVRVFVEGLGVAEVAVDGLEPGETRAVRVVVEAGEIPTGETISAGPGESVSHGRGGPPPR